MTDAAALRNAPVDDEPETEEERQAVAEARRSAPIIRWRIWQQTQAGLRL
jgi:hypothetical protein